MFVGNAENGVTDVMTSKCEVDKDKKGLFVQLLQWAMIPEEANRKTMNFIETKEKVDLFKEQNIFGLEC